MASLVRYVISGIDCVLRAWPGYRRACTEVIRLSDEITRISGVAAKRRENLENLSTEHENLRFKFSEMEQNAGRVLEELERLRVDARRESERAEEYGRRVDELEALIENSPPVHRSAFRLIERLRSGVGLGERDGAVFELSSLGQIMRCRGSALKRLGYDARKLSGSEEGRQDLIEILHPEDASRLRDELIKIGKDRGLQGFELDVGVKYRGDDVYSPYLLSVSVRRKDKDVREANPFSDTFRIRMKRRAVGRGLSKAFRVETLSIPDGIESDRGLYRKVIGQLRELREKVSRGFVVALNFEKLYPGDETMNDLLQDIFSSGYARIVSVSDDLVYTALRMFDVYDALGIRRDALYLDVKESLSRRKKMVGRTEREGEPGLA